MRARTMFLESLITNTMNTTILGLLAAVAATIQVTVQQGHLLTDWKTWILPAALAALGFLANDSKPPTSQL